VAVAAVQGQQVQELPVAREQHQAFLVLLLHTRVAAAAVGRELREQAVAAVAVMAVMLLMQG
jgi:hypothetical protein